MEATIEELKELRQAWEDRLINLARLPKPSRMAVYYAMEKVRAYHVEICELEAELEASKNRLAKHGIMFG